LDGLQEGRHVVRKRKGQHVATLMIYDTLYAFFWVIPRRLNYSEESIQHSEHGESLKSRVIYIYIYI